MPPDMTPSRRSFLSSAAFSSAAAAAGLLGSALPAAYGQEAPESGLLVIGPRPGYTPQIGTLVSMLTYMQSQVLIFVKGLKQPDLDFLFDPKANTIGALLLHLAATETYYQMNTFENKKWDSWSDEIKKKWDPAMNLGDAGRQAIKGHDLDFYLNALKETREHSLAEFRKRDDAWLASLNTEQFGTAKVNIYWKWFHVCEHQSHHAGQIGFLVKRLPGYKPHAE